MTADEIQRLLVHLSERLDALDAAVEHLTAYAL